MQTRMTDDPLHGNSLPSTTPGCPISRSFFARCGISRTSTLLHLPDLTSNGLASLAREALIAEAELTPKPALVDRRGSGAHHDLSLALMRQSATAIEPYFAAMASCSQGPRPRLQFAIAAGSDRPQCGTRHVPGHAGKQRPQGCHLDSWSSGLGSYPRSAARTLVRSSPWRVPSHAFLIARNRDY